MHDAPDAPATHRGEQLVALDVFGKTAERRAERQLIADYLAMVGEFAQSLSHDRLDTAIALALLPEDIRGFGHVKHAKAGPALARVSLRIPGRQERRGSPSGRPCRASR